MATPHPLNSNYLPTAGEGPVSQWHGTYTATVVNNHDPLGVGRLQLNVPQVLGNAVSGWAVPLGTYFAIPGNGSTVSASFIGGDPAQPVWSGALDLAPSVNSGATATTYSGSAPPNPKVGDIWVPITIFDGGETTGTPQVWTFNSGTSTYAWVTQPKLGPTSITNGAITAALLGTDVTALIDSKTTTVANISTGLPTKGTVGDVWMQVNTTGIITSIMVCTTSYASGAGTLADWTTETSLNARALGSPYVYQQSLTPNTANNGSNPPQVDDLWINTGSDNVIEQMTAGTSASPTWTQFQIGAQAIQDGTVKAGIIDGTTITGATFLGTNWVENSSGMFLYSGTPAFGNLLMSISNVTGTDAHGNGWEAGIVLYGPSKSSAALIDNGSAAAVQLQPPGVTQLSDVPQVYAFASNAGGSGEQQYIVMSSGATNGNHATQLFLRGQSGDTRAPAQVTFQFGSSAVITFTETSGAARLLVNGSTSTSTFGVLGDAHISGNVVVGNLNGSATLPLGTVSTVTGTSTTVQLASAINGLISRLQSVGIIS